LCLRYAVNVAVAFLELILQERSSIIERTKKRIKKDLAAAIDALKKIPSRTALQELDDMLTGGGGIDWGGGSNTIDTVSRAEALQKTKATLREIEEVMLEKSASLLPLCPSPSTATKTVMSTVLGSPSATPSRAMWYRKVSILLWAYLTSRADVGGSYLRRSVWKKSPVWQFCATNLNVNAMSWHKFKNTDFQERSAVSYNGY
jgi:hypothetical protein